MRIVICDLNCTIVFQKRTFSFEILKNSTQINTDKNGLEEDARPKTQDIRQEEGTSSLES